MHPAQLNTAHRTDRHGSATVTLPTDTTILIARSFDAPAALVFEGYPDAEAVNTIQLTEAGSVTTMQVTVLHSTREHRDGHVDTGMEGGMQLTMNRIDDALAALSAGAR